VSSSAIELAVKRGQLIERSAHLRRRIEQESHAVQRVCHAADQVGDSVRKVRAHPEWVFAGVLALIVLKPKRLWRWGKTGVFVWRGYATLRPHLTKLFQT
jgi:hypothetical protein